MDGGVDGAEDELDELAGRRKPNPPVASLAGTPWDSRQLVNLARAAAAAPLLPAAGAVVVVAADVLVEPPQPAASAVSAERGTSKRRAGCPERPKGRRARIRLIFERSRIRRVQEDP